MWANYLKICVNHAAEIVLFGKKLCCHDSGVKNFEEVRLLELLCRPSGGLRLFEGQGQIEKKGTYCTTWGPVKASLTNRDSADRETLKYYLDITVSPSAPCKNAENIC